MNTITNDFQNSMPIILIADDEKNIRYSLKRMFSEKEYEILEAKNGSEAIDIIKKSTPDLVLMDIQMGDSSGLDTLKEIKAINSKIPVIIMTAFGTTQTAIEAMKYGAFDYILKPFDVSLMWKLVEDALHINQLMKTDVSYNTKEYIPGIDCIIGSSALMQEIYKMIGRIADKDITVLILGETGTGKELIARAIYRNSKRNIKPYIPINCAAIPDALLESELFGYEKGAFTDAQMRKIGKFEQCNGGTIFLDEIGDMSMNTQAKILRVLQEKEIVRLGSNEPIKVDVRIIAATNKNLEDKDAFRQDLYYRLNVVTINLPPLRERKEDIEELSNYFLKKFNIELNKNIINLSADALKKLFDYNWPGNIRELENVLKRACVLCKGLSLLPTDINFDLKKITSIDILNKNLDSLGIEELINEVYNKINLMSAEDREDILPFIEKAIIVRVLKDTNGNQLKSAKILGMNRNTLRNKIEKYDIKINTKIEN